MVQIKLLTERELLLTVGKLLTVRCNRGEGAGEGAGRLFHLN